MRLPFYCLARRVVPASLTDLSGFGLRVVLLAVVVLCGITGEAVRLVVIGSRRIISDHPGGVLQLSGGMLILVVVSYGSAIGFLAVSRHRTDDMEKASTYPPGRHSSSPQEEPPISTE